MHFFWTLYPCLLNPKCSFRIIFLSYLGGLTTWLLRFPDAEVKLIRRRDEARKDPQNDRSNIWLVGFWLVVFWLVAFSTPASDWLPPEEGTRSNLTFTAARSPFPKELRSEQHLDYMHIFKLYSHIYKIKLLCICVE